MKSDPLVGTAVAQALPPPHLRRASSVAVGAVKWGEIRQAGSVRVFEIHARGWWRWGVGPLLQLLSLLYFGIAVGHVVAFFRTSREERIEAGGCANTLTFVCSTGAAVLCGWLFWCAFASGWGRETITAGADAVEHRSFAAGIDLGAERWPHPIAIVPAGPSWTVIYEEGGRRQAAFIRFMADGDLNGAACMNEALHAPP